MMIIFRSLGAKLAASAAVFLVVVIIGWLVPLTPPASFQVAARIWVQSRGTAEGGGDSHQSSSVFQSFMTYFNSPILTACEVLRSTVVLEEAVKDLKGKLPASDTPTLDNLKGSITVEPVRDTDIVTIGYRSGDGYVGTIVVQAVLDAFARLESHQASYSAIQSQTFLKEQLADAKNQLKDINERIKQFQSVNGVINVTAEVEDLVKERSSLMAAQKNAQMQSQVDRQKSQLLAERLGISADDAMKASQLAGDPVFMETNKRVAQLEFEYASLSTQLRPEHPRMRQLKNLITQLRTASRERLGVLSNQLGIVPKLSTTGKDSSQSAGSLSEEALRDLVAAKSDETTQQTRAALLSGNLNRVEAELKQLPDKELQSADLLRAQKVIFERISGLEASINSAKMIEAINTHTPNFQVVDRPQVIGVTVASKRPKLLTALLLAVVLGALTFFGLDWLDPRLRRIPAVLETLPLPVIGWFSHLTSAAHLESMHRLRLSLKDWVTGQRKQFVVTSSDTGDGKSTVAAGLARSFAQSGMSVLLVDANVERPSLHERIKDVALSPGLSDFLTSPNPQLWSKIVVNAGDNLKIIPAGSKASSGRLLSSDVLPQLMHLAQQEADIVIYDTPAICESAAALALLSSNVNLLIVVRLGHTHLPSLRLLATQVKQHECAASGLILANVDDYVVAAALAKTEQQEELEPV